MQGVGDRGRCDRSSDVRHDRTHDADTHCVDDDQRTRTISQHLFSHVEGCDMPARPLAKTVVSFLNVYGTLLP